MIQMSSSKFDTRFFFCWGRRRLLLRTKWLQSLCYEILFDSPACEYNTKSPLNMHTDCRKVSVALALSEFYDCFSNRLGELRWGSGTGFVEDSDVVCNPCVLGFLELEYPPSHRCRTTTHSLCDRTPRHSAPIAP